MVRRQKWIKKKKKAGRAIGVLGIHQADYITGGNILGSDRP